VHAVGATTLKGKTDPTGGGLAQGRPCESPAAIRNEEDRASNGAGTGERERTARADDGRIKFRVSHTRRIDKTQVLLIRPPRRTACHVPFTHV
jgi:hypothetical protein